MTEVAIGPKSRLFVSSRFPDGVDRLIEGIETGFGGSTIGNIWRTAEVIVRSGIDWTGWVNYHDGLRSAYLSALGDTPEYRHGTWASDKERKADMWSHNQLAFSLKQRLYVPDEVPMPTFLEGRAAKPSVLRSMSECNGVSMDVIHDYFLKSFDSQQFLQGNDGYEVQTWQSLIDVGMIVSGDDIPVAAAITDLSMAEARSALRTLSEKPERSLSSNLSLITTCHAADEGRVQDALASVRDWTTTYYVLPPPAMTWSDFQSMRQQVKGMAVALGDLYVDVIRRKYPLDHMTLTSP